MPSGLVQAHQVAAIPVIAAESDFERSLTYTGPPPVVVRFARHAAMAAWHGASG